MSTQKRPSSLFLRLGDSDEETSSSEASDKDLRHGTLVLPEGKVIVDWSATAHNEAEASDEPNELRESNALPYEHQHHGDTEEDLPIENDDDGDELVFQFDVHGQPIDPPETTNNELYLEHGDQASSLSEDASHDTTTAATTLYQPQMRTTPPYPSREEEEEEEEEENDDDEVAATAVIAVDKTQKDTIEATPSIPSPPSPHEPIPSSTSPHIRRRHHDPCFLRSFQERVRDSTATSSSFRTTRYGGATRPSDDIVLSVQVVFDCVPIERCSKAVWGWPYAVWPVHVFLSFSMRGAYDLKDYRIAFEMNRLDQRVEWIDEPAVLAGMARRPYVLPLNERQCRALYTECIRMANTARYDVWQERISWVPWLGSPMVQAWLRWTRRHPTPEVWVTSYGLIYQAFQQSVFQHESAAGVPQYIHSMAELFLFMERLPNQRRARAEDQV